MSSNQQKDLMHPEAEAKPSEGPRPWVPPELTVVGSITEVIRSTPGKTGSSFDTDMFATRKPGGGA
jgi:hypothetical protein